MHVAIVIPALNEEKGIAWVLNRIHYTLRGKNYHMLVVDGGSTDRTVEIAKIKGAEVISQNGRGYGDAYIKGFKYALEKYALDIMVMLDADGTYDPAEIPSLINPIVKNEADVVIGSRFKGQIKKDAMSWLHRYVGNPILTKFSNLFYKVGISDAHCGFRAIEKCSREAKAKISWNRIRHRSAHRNNQEEIKS